MSTQDLQHLQQAAKALRQARSSKQSIARISEHFAISSLDDAYRVASINTEYQLAQGARIVGKKVGLTSVAVQQQLGVDQPDFGMLFADMEYLSGDEIPADRLMQAKIEAEIAFVMAKDLGADMPSWGEFIHAIGYALPALEIVDSAITDWKITLVDTVADNASCGLYVLGDQPIVLGTQQLADIEMRLHKNQVLVSQGIGKACLGHPLKAAWWLAKTMAQRGMPLKAGEVILSGALGPMVDIQHGDVIHADFGAMGQVSCKIV